MKVYWFKRKTYGWGWTPATWQGWCIVLLLLVALIANFFRIEAASPAVNDTLTSFLPQTITWILLLVVISWFTGEKPMWQWGRRPVFLHTRLRVGNLERSISFYAKLGFTVTKRTERSPAGNELAFLELSGSEHFLELAYSAHKPPQVPEDLVHTAIGYPNLIARCSELEKQGIPVWPDGWREKFKTEKKMAFVTDPDGYEVELLERR